MISTRTLIIFISMNSTVYIFILICQFLLQIFLPHMKKKSEQQKATDGEKLSEHWVVSDMMTFENVGFTNTVGTAKYLICADCEVGPVGWHDVTDKTKYFIALDRVQHK